MPGDLLLGAKQMDAATQVPLPGMRFNFGQKGAGFHLRTFKPGLLTADGDLVEGNGLHHQKDQDGEAQEPGDEVHFLTSFRAIS